MIKNEKYVDVFKNLGRLFPPSQCVMDCLEEYVCKLYKASKCKKVNDARFTLFKSGKYAEVCLPPNQDSCIKHAERANFQAGIWWRALVAKPSDIPSPIGNGWMCEDEGLVINWMSLPPAPDSILELINCKCKAGCDTRRCSCLNEGLKCTDLCGCKNCTNNAQSNPDVEDNDSDDNLSIGNYSDSSSSSEDED